MSREETTAILSDGFFILHFRGSVVDEMGYFF